MHAIQLWHSFKDNKIVPFRLLQTTLTKTIIEQKMERRKEKKRKNHVFVEINFNRSQSSDIIWLITWTGPFPFSFGMDSKGSKVKNSSTLGMSYFRVINMIWTYYSSEKLWKDMKEASRKVPQKQDRNVNNVNHSSNMVADCIGELSSRWWTTEVGCSILPFCNGVEDGILDSICFVVEL